MQRSVWRRGQRHARGTSRRSRRLWHLNNLCRLGLGNIRPFERLPPEAAPMGSYGRCALASPGKDTTTGHWEMAGIHLAKPFPVYPERLPAAEVMDGIRAAGSGGHTLGNKAASGTQIFDELGKESMRTGSPSHVHPPRIASFRLRHTRK